MNEENKTPQPSVSPETLATPPATTIENLSALPGVKASLVDKPPEDKLKPGVGRSLEGKIEAFPALDRVDEMIDRDASISEISNFIMGYGADSEGKPFYRYGDACIRHYVKRKKVAIARSGKPLMEQRVEREKQRAEMEEARKRADELFLHATNVPLDELLDVSQASKEAADMMKSPSTREIVKRVAIHRLTGQQAKIKGLSCVWQMLTISELLKDEGIRFEGIVPRTLSDWVKLCQLQLEALKTMKELLGEQGGREDVAETLTAFIKKLGVPRFGGGSVAGYKATVRQPDGSARVVEGMHKEMPLEPGEQEKVIDLTKEDEEDE